MKKNNYPHLFAPLEVKGRIIKNRVMSAPNMLFHTVDGRADDFYIGYLEHKARGGAGIVNLGEVSVGDGGNHTPEMIKNLDNMPVFAEMSACIREHGALASAEITHGGMRGKPQFNREIMPIGPSPFVSMYDGKEYPGMTIEDMDRVVKQYADTTEYMLSCGFDTVLLHFGHSWLPAQFLSPIVNQRIDEFGGSLENRMRFPLRILKTVRERVGKDQMIMMRISGSERMEGGFTDADITEFISLAQEYIDLVEVSCENFTDNMASTYRPLGLNVEFADHIKNSGKVHIPVFSVGSILHPEQAEEIIASGKADGVSMSRGLIADPYMPEKAFAGKAYDVTPCLRCLNCTDGDNADRHMVCSVNPLIGREARLGFGEDIGTARHKKRVLVIGGGPAGMEAAITAAERGHDVTLAEKSDALGGAIKFTDYDSLKADLHRYKDFLVKKTERAGVRILLNTEVTPEFVENYAPDDIILATGAVPVKPPIPGIENAFHAAEAYYDPEKAGKETVIIGGGLIGVETALHLMAEGKNAVVLEQEDDIIRDARGLYRFGVLRKAQELNLTVITSAHVKEITKDSVVYEKDGQEFTLPCDSVLYAVGMASCRSLYQKLAGNGARIAVAGDARKVGKIAGAVHDGFFAALDIGRI
ncbi:MAG: FAD-dependent oxidoreductase [Eubacterium sp.]|nr:FAD-dependent oxidoreductase [Eubacterium sp.]